MRKISAIWPMKICRHGPVYRNIQAQATIAAGNRRLISELIAKISKNAGFVSGLDCAHGGAQGLIIQTIQLTSEGT